MQILPTLIALSLLAFSAASPTPDDPTSDQDATCLRACGGNGGRQEWCAAGARDALLRSLGCFSKANKFMSSASFVYHGGLLERRYRDSNCYSRFNSAPNNAIMVDCSAVRKKLSSVINACFVGRDDGAGSDYLPASPEFLYFAITTCPGRWKRSTYDQVDGKKTMSADAELRQVIDFLLNEEEGGQGEERKKKDERLMALMEKKKDKVISFPYSGRDCMTLAELAEIEPRLKAKYNL